MIHVFLNGGMSQVDTFDPKPETDSTRGANASVRESADRAQDRCRSPFSIHLSTAWGERDPDQRFVSKAGDLCGRHAVIRSMYAELPSHEMMLLLMNTGHSRLVRPSFGSWLNWGMGSDNQNLPGFIVLCPGGLPVAGAGNWRSSFLPGVYQGTLVDTAQSDPTRLIEHIRNQRLTTQQQQSQFQLLQAMNHKHLAQRPGEASLEARIESFEMAYRMQVEATDAFDISQEPEHILKAYGEGPQNRQLLIARRLVERGVRFVQTWHGAMQPWDSHSNIKDEHRRVANECDQGLAALDQGFEAARPVGQDVDPVQRGVRSDPVGGDGAERFRRVSRPRPQPLGLFALDGRGWHQRGNDLRRDRRLWLQSGRKSRLRS